MNIYAKLIFLSFLLSLSQIVNLAYRNISVSPEDCLNQNTSTTYYKQTSFKPVSTGNFRLDISKDPVFRIYIDRKLVTKDCVMGYLGINDNKAICHTLELPYKGNETDISSIPAGRYTAFIRRYNFTLKSLIKGWRIELRNVPFRDNIQIHAGFWTFLPFNGLNTSDTKGCILVGKRFKECELFDDRDAMMEISNEFSKFEKELILSSSSTKPVRIEIEISDPGQ